MLCYMCRPQINYMMDVGLVGFFVCLFAWVFFYQVSNLVKYELEPQLTDLKV